MQSDNLNKIDDYEKLTINIIPTNGYEEEIKEYLKKDIPTVYILTPCYGGMCTVNYLISLIGTISLFQQLKIPLKIEFCRNDSLVTRARNNLAAKAMCDENMTHIIFIDGDITWEPMDVIKLLISDKPLIGGAYPLKKYNWNKIQIDPSNLNPISSLLQKKKNAQLTMTDEDIIRVNLVNYNVNYLSNSIAIERNLTEVRHLATGFMMIHRNVISTMHQHLPETKYIDDVGYLSLLESRNAYALFDCAIVDGHYLSEDWLFCHRWRELNGKVFLDVSINLTHTGVEDFKGCYMSSVL